jgi:hypothetical protein
MRQTLLWATLAVTLAAPAFANQCPMLMGRIEEAMATSSADNAIKSQATTLLEEGRTAHEAGDHATSEAKLNEALALLGQ